MLLSRILHVGLTCYLFLLVQLRLKSVQNIEKITKSMKMIASTKVNKAQRGMDAARAFGAASNGKNDGMDKREMTC